MVFGGATWKKLTGNIPGFISPMNRMEISEFIS